LNGVLSQINQFSSVVENVSNHHLYEFSVSSSYTTFNNKILRVKKYSHQTVPREAISVRSAPMYSADRLSTHIFQKCLWRVIGSDFISFNWLFGQVDSDG